jgi:TRAP-type C4-dicarboxylate transport system permease large subunit
MMARPDALLANIRKRAELFGTLQGAPSAAHACIAKTLEQMPDDNVHDAVLYSAVTEALSTQGLMNPPARMGTVEG